MNKKRYIALTLMLSLLSINKVYAECSKNVKDEFEQVKSKYNITTKYDSTTKTYTMDIETEKDNRFKYIFSINYEYECKKIDDTLKKCTGLKPGTTFYAYILGNSKECQEFITEEVIHLNKLNEFYEDPLCEGIEEFVLCQEIYDREIDRETFEKRVNSYKESKQKKQEEEQKQIEEENKMSNKAEIFIKDNLIQIIIVIVFIILVIISAIVGYKASRKSRRLE